MIFTYKIQNENALIDMKKLYDFLGPKGKDKFGLDEPSTIPTWEMIEEKRIAICQARLI